MSTFLELKTTLLNTELGTQDTTQLFTLTRRGDAINAAQREFAALTGCLERQATISLSDGDQEKDLETVIAADDFIELVKDNIALKKTSGSIITYLAGPNDFPRRDIPWLDRHYAGWRSAAAGTPGAFYIREDGGQVFLGLVPALDILGSDTWQAVIPYSAYPSNMSADADEPFTVSSNPKRILRPYHPALVHHAAANLELLRKNYQAYDRQMEQFNAYVTRYTQKQRRPGGQHVLMARDYLGEAGRRRGA